MKKGSAQYVVAAAAVLLCAVLLVLVVLPRISGTAASSGSAADARASSNPSDTSTDASTTASTTDDAASDANAATDVPPEEDASADASGDGAGPYETGVALIQVKDGVTADQVNAMLATMDEITTKAVTDEEVASGLVKVELAAGVSVEDAVSHLEQNADIVDGAQPNYRYVLMDDEVVGDGADLQAATSPVLSVQADVTDPSAKQSATDARHWQLDNRSGCGVQAYTAWDTTKCDKTVSVAIIDTGCDTTHPDLAANIVDTYDSVNDNTDVTDETGHGTHVAGIVSAVANNAVGTAGVSYNAGLVIIQAISSDGYFWTDNLAAAYDHLLGKASSDANGDGVTGTVAQEYDVKVVNMSLGGEGECPSDDVLLKRVDAAYAAGIVTVCAAGNRDADSGCIPPFADTPGDYATCVSVMNLSKATGSLALATNDGNVSSNYNASGSTAKNISAPGSSIYSTYPRNLNSSGYAYMSGTSMASPLVAGVVALEFAANPSLSAGQAKAVLYDSAYDLGATGWDETYGYGEADAAAAVSEASVALGGPESLLLGSTGSYSIDAQTGRWAWSSSDSSILSINASTGAATAKGAGTVTVTAAEVMPMTTTKTAGSASSADGSARTVSMEVTVYSASISGASSIVVGNTASYSVAASPSTGRWTWSSSDTSVASVGSTSGVVSAKAAGTFTLTASLATNSAICVTKTVTVAAIPVWTLSVPENTILVGQTMTVSYSAPSGQTGCSLVVSNTDLASIDAATGTFTAKAPGEVTISLVDSGGITQKSATVTIVRTVDLASAGVTVASANMTYTGSVLEPEVVVECEGVTLERGTDYTVSYADNIYRGTATITVAGVVDASGNGYTGTASATFEVVPAITRLAGAGALDTMESIENEGHFSTGGTVVVASIDGYLDALAASGLAGLSNGTVLLTDGTSLSSQTRSQLASLKPSKVYVAGGTAAVSDTVLSQIKTAVGSAASVTRLGGAGATDTAELLYKQGTGAATTWSKTCIIATANSFQDALSIAPYAYAKHAPIFLTRPSVNILSDSTVTTIKAAGFTDAVIVGGSSAVSNVVYTQLMNIGIGNGSTTSNDHVTRLWGNGAYDTSLAIAKWELTNGLSTSEVSVATGEGYWDALTGASLSGHNGTILVLASDGNQTCITGFVEPHASSISRIYVYGGKAAVSPTLYSKLQVLIGA